MCPLALATVPFVTFRCLSVTAGMQSHTNTGELRRGNEWVASGHGPPFKPAFNMTPVAACIKKKLNNLAIAPSLPFAYACAHQWIPPDLLSSPLGMRPVWLGSGVRRCWSAALSMAMSLGTPSVCRHVTCGRRSVRGGCAPPLVPTPVDSLRDTQRRGVGVGTHQGGSELSQRPRVLPHVIQSPRVRHLVSKVTCAGVGDVIELDRRVYVPVRASLIGDELADREARQGEMQHSRGIMIVVLVYE